MKKSENEVILEIQKPCTQTREKEKVVHLFPYIYSTWQARATIWEAYVKPEKILIF